MVNTLCVHLIYVIATEDKSFMWEIAEMLYVELNVRYVSVKGTDQHFVKYTYLLCGQKVDEKIDTSPHVCPWHMKL